LQSIPTDVAALIAVREVTRICVRHQSSSAVTVQTLASSVGRLYELEVRIREATQVNPLYMKRVQDALDDKNVRSFKHLMGVYTKAYKKVLGKDLMSTLTNSELVHLGKFGVDACYQAGIITQRRTTGSRGLLVMYDLNPDVRTYITGYTQHDVRTVTAVETGAMLCPPDPWTSMYDGGYLSVRRKAVHPLVATKRMRRGLRKD